jgi:phosphoribosylglycinamide formyltransferase-1
MTPDSVSRLAVLISGRGSNLQAIIDAIRDGRLDAAIAVVISNRDGTVGLRRAREAGIEAIYLDPREYPDRDAYDRALADLLRQRDVDLVCLAGFMRLVRTPLIEAFPEQDSQYPSVAAPRISRARGATAGARTRRARSRG